MATRVTNNMLYRTSLFAVTQQRLRLAERQEQAATGLELNEIGRVQLRTTLPLFADEYRRNRGTGSFVLIDEQTNNTVGAGMILDTEATG